MNTCGLLLFTTDGELAKPSGCTQAVKWNANTPYACSAVDEKNCAICRVAFSWKTVLQRSKPSNLPVVKDQPVVQRYPDRTVNRGSSPVGSGGFCAAV